MALGPTREASSLPPTRARRAGPRADREIGSSSYILQPGGGMHVDECKEGAQCIELVYQDQKADILWPPR